VLAGAPEADVAKQIVEASTTTPARDRNGELRKLTALVIVYALTWRAIGSARFAAASH